MNLLSWFIFILGAVNDSPLPIGQEKMLPSIHYQSSGTRLQIVLWHKLQIDHFMLVAYIKSFVVQPYTRSWTCPPGQNDILTHSYLSIPLEIVVWIYDTFDNNFWIKNYFSKYLKEICWYCFDKHFSFNYFLMYAFTWKISPTLSGCIGVSQHEWVESILSHALPGVCRGFNSFPPGE